MTFGARRSAVALFAVMSEAKSQPNVVSYTAAVSACQKGGHWQAAWKIFVAMPEEWQDAISYDAAIKACEKGGKGQKTLKTLEAMSKTTSSNILQDVGNAASAVSSTSLL